MFHRDPTLPVSRRAALSRIGAGFGTLGLASMLADEQARGATSAASPLAPRSPHFAPRAVGSPGTELEFAL